MDILVITGTTVVSATTYIITAQTGQQVAYSQFLTTGDVISGCLLLAILVVMVYGRIVSVGRGNR
jgi:hypothetical protein